MQANPIFKQIQYPNLQQLYSSDNSARYQLIIDGFTQAYGAKPNFIARAPGRVNIIGQHIDYQGYGVLPAAIEKDCLIAVGYNETDQVVINHALKEQYPACKLPVDPEKKVDFEHNYSKYFRAGYRAGVKHTDHTKLRGLNLFIQGNVPPAAGVSSSSALCVCSALAASHANNLDDTFKSKQDFIERVIVGQRQTGTASGGMDQSISVMGQRNSCLYIQFNPIRSTPVQLPQGCRFVVMNSLVESAKLNTAVFRYNKRVCECRMAIAILGAKLGIPVPEGKQHHMILQELETWSGLPVNTLGGLVDDHIPRKPYTVADVEALINKPVSDLLNDIPLWKEVLQANDTFRLYQAARHVFDQAYRVINYTKVCESALSDRDKLFHLGKLMNQSQDSCRDLYQCSCPEIDQITQLALKNGAYGSRLTGAGWGGCTVSLVAADKSQAFIDVMVEQYYNTKPELKEKIDKVGIASVVFESVPAQGACIVKL